MDLETIQIFQFLKSFKADVQGDKIFLDFLMIANESHKTIFQIPMILKFKPFTQYALEQSLWKTNYFKKTDLN